MGKGILRLSSHKLGDWFLSGKQMDDIKELLLLPPEYSIEKIYKNPDDHKEICIILSSQDIPEIPSDNGLHANLSFDYDASKFQMRLTIEPYSFSIEYGKNITPIEVAQALI